MNRYPWLYSIEEQWKNILDSNNIPHALLLSGSKGLGKNTLAYCMSNMALCENRNGTEVCHQCKPCLLLKSGNHTDLRTIRADGELIKVSQIRELTSEINLSSARGSYKIVIIENAEKMNSASANALLKTLEEPPRKTIIMLTTDDIGRLLPTITSRCLKINIPLPDKKLILNWLQDNNFQADPSSVALSLSGGAPLTARNLLENDLLINIGSLLEDLNSISKGSKNIADTTRSWIENEYIKLLPYIAQYFLNALKSEYKMESGIEIPDANFNRIPIQLLKKSMHQFIRDIYQLLQNSNSVLKLELQLHELLTNWKNISKN